RADQADLVTTQDSCAETINNQLVSITLTDIVEISHDLAGAFTGANFKLDLPLPITTRGTLQPQRFQTPHTPFITRTTCLHTLAYPDFLLCKKFVELGILDFLVFQQLSLTRLIGTEITRERQQSTTVEFDNTGSNIVEKTSVVRDEQHTA